MFVNAASDAPLAAREPSVIVASLGEVVMAKDVVVVGGGISGLAIAWEMLSAPGLLPLASASTCSKPQGAPAATSARSAGTDTCANGADRVFWTTSRRPSPPAVASDWAHG